MHTEKGKASLLHFAMQCLEQVAFFPTTHPQGRICLCDSTLKEIHAGDVVGARPVWA